MIFGIAALSGVVLICLAAYFGVGHFKSSQAPSQAAAQSQAAQIQAATELISATGKVLILKSGKTEWQEVKMGARLMEGDLVQTDDSGEASIRYPNGTTVSIPAKTTLAVQITGNSQMEIVMPSGALEAGTPGGGIQAAAGTAGQNARPSIKLQRIIPYGRSLELIGSVEAGSTLAVNNERVEVGGDGSFKHFTKRFPPTSGAVHLVLKVTDLAGRANVVTTTYDFGLHEDN